METTLTLAAGLLAVLGCAWLLNRTPPFLALPKGEAAVTEPDERRLQEYGSWFVHMRWVAVLLSVVLVASSTKFRFLPRETTPPLLFIVAAVAASNLLFPRLATGRFGVRAALTLQLYADLGFLTVLLHLSGGVENPLYLLPVFNVLLAGMVLSRRQCFALAWSGGLVCAAAVLAEWAQLVPHYTLRVVPHGEHGDFHVAFDAPYVVARTALQLGMMLLTAHFVSRLAEHSRAHEGALASTAEAARDGRELLEQALENTGTGLRVVDAVLRPLLVNQQWRRWFPGQSLAEERLVAWTVAHGSAPRLTLADSAVRRTEVAVAADRGEGQRTYLVTTAPLHDRDGRIDRVVELAQDVTSEKATQARMLAACKLAAVGEVAGKLAHEINNPIAIISAKGRLLLSDRQAEMSEKVGREVQRTVELADRVAGIARGLLAYGRPSIAPRSRIDVREPLRHAFSLVEQQAILRGVRLVDELGGAALLVDASASEMEQVFLNLFLNALDAMPAGGVLAVSGGASQLADGGPAVAAIVTDTGPGVPDELRERIFEPFFTTKEEGHGTGLGLSVCQGIVRHHGGEILVERGSGQGARFVVRLPQAPAGGGEASRG
ncbi:MAG: PAS domain-containing protein [Acidobacteria bacterium]|nr:PAS domain-containing protein [Acidobacteriota bacterium]